MNILLITGAFFGLTGVALSAFTHHLADADIADRVLIGVNQQLLHAVIIVLTGLGLHMQISSRMALLLKISGGLFSLGIILFAGNIYLTYLLGISQLSFLIPFGGGTLMLAWLVVLITGFTCRPDQSDSTSRS